MTEEELKHRHLIRIHRNQKHKHRDRYKPICAEVLYLFPTRRHSGEEDYEFNRRKAAPGTGFGVAYEKNPDAKKYRGN